MNVADGPVAHDFTAPSLRILCVPAHPRLMLASPLRPPVAKPAGVPKRCNRSRHIHRHKIRSWRWREGCELGVTPRRHNRPREREGR